MRFRLFIEKLIQLQVKQLMRKFTKKQFEKIVELEKVKMKQLRN